MSRTTRWLVFVIAFCGAPHANATILVLLAESDLNSSAFSSIVASIRDTNDEAEIRSIDPDSLDETVALAEKTHSAIILLGRKLIEEPFNTPDDIPVLLGGYYGTLNVLAPLPRISLNIDPEYVLRQVEKTGSQTKRALSSLSEVVESSIEIERLKALQGLEVVLFNANSEREAARGWFDVMLEARSESDLVWILDDEYMDSSGAYRYLIEKAWRQKILVVASIPSFSRRGVALGFIPVLSSYGELLVEAIETMRTDREFVPDPLIADDAVRRVFNKRSLEHVGRRLPSDLDRGAHTDIVIE